jgi:hypothetical protein
MAISYLRTIRLNVRFGNILVITTAAAIGAPSPRSLLDQALHFADFYNWYAARPLFEQARRLFEAAGDGRNALYARWGAIRAGTEPAPITELSTGLGESLLIPSCNLTKSFACFAWPSKAISMAKSTALR